MTIYVDFQYSLKSNSLSFVNHETDINIIIQHYASVIV